MSRFSHRKADHPTGGWPVLYLDAADDQGRVTTVAFSPEQGSNWLGFSVAGTEYMFGASERQGKVGLLGSPVLYPMPNRVRNATFAFDGRTFNFPANNGANFLHGLVRDQAWECDAPVAHADGISATARIRFEPGKSYYDLFPIRNCLELTYTAKPGLARLDFTVTNEDAAARLPFGLAIHPYFSIIGGRDQVRLLVPATHWMEATDLLPSGKLADLKDGPADLRQPTALSALNLDDVYYGLRQSAPQVIYYDAIGKKITLTAPDFFRYSVVYTPPPMPFFCVENQSCSTDAHNLHAKGLVKEASLTILEPGQSFKTWIEVSVSEQ
jgi:aldose 1-epimerase